MQRSKIKKKLRSNFKEEETIPSSQEGGKTNEKYRESSKVEGKNGHVRVTCKGIVM